MLVFSAFLMTFILPAPLSISAHKSIFDHFVDDLHAMKEAILPSVNISEPESQKVTEFVQYTRKIYDDYQVMLNKLAGTRVLNVTPADFEKIKSIKSNKLDEINETSHNAIAAFVEDPVISLADDYNATSLLLEALDVTHASVIYHNVSIMFQNQSDNVDNFLQFFLNETLMGNDSMPLNGSVLTLFKSEGAAKESFYYTLIILSFLLAVICTTVLTLWIVWRRRGTHGEWVINETDYGKKQPVLAAFQNECFTMDSKLLSAYSTNDGQMSGAQNRNANVAYAVDVDSEMMEMVENSFSNNGARY